MTDVEASSQMQASRG